MKHTGVIIAAAVLSTAACGPGEGTGPGEAVVVRVVTMAPSPISEEVVASTRLEGLDEALVYPGAGGRVEEVLVSEGDSVTAGTPLVRLSSDAQFLAGSSAASAGVAAARSAEQNAARALERMRSLYEAGAVSVQELETAETMYASAEAARQQAVAGASQAYSAAENSLIVAPFDGRIGRIWVREGNMAGGGPAVSISNAENLRAEVLVPERFLAMLEPGQTARVSVIAYGEESFPGIVTATARSVDPVSGLVPVEVAFGNPDGRLYPGMGGRVAIAVRTSENAMVLPDVALRRLADGYEVALEVDGVARMVPVATGIMNDGLVEIVEGLNPGDRVIVEGQLRVADGDPVREAEDEAASGQPASE